MDSKGANVCNTRFHYLIFNFGSFPPKDAHVIVNLLDLVERFPTSIFLQKLAEVRYYRTYLLACFDTAENEPCKVCRRVHRRRVLLVDNGNGGLGIWDREPRSGIVSAPWLPVRGGRKHRRVVAGGIHVGVGLNQRSGAAELEPKQET